MSAIPPDPFEDIMAPPLRVVGASSAARRRVEPGRDASVGTDPARVPDNVIILRNPLGATPRRVERVSDPTDDDDLFGIVAPPEEAGEAPARQPQSRLPLASPPVEADEAPPAEPRSGRSQLKFGVVVGLILAAGIVLLAILFRPVPAAPPPKPAATLHQSRHASGALGSTDAHRRDAPRLAKTHRAA